VLSSRNLVVRGKRRGLSLESRRVQYANEKEMLYGRPAGGEFWFDLFSCQKQRSVLNGVTCATEHHVSLKRAAFVRLKVKTRWVRPAFATSSEAGLDVDRRGRPPPTCASTCSGDVEAASSTRHLRREALFKRGWRWMSPRRDSGRTSRREIIMGRQRAGGCVDQALHRADSCGPGRPPPQLHDTDLAVTGRWRARLPGAKRDSWFSRALQIFRFRT